MRDAFLFAVAGVFVATATANAEKIRLVEIRRPAGGFRGGTIIGVPHSHATPVPIKMRRVQPKIWAIPAGKFGLQLSDGTRIIGVPAKGWSASIKTSFGTVSIPLAQIHHVATAGEKGVTVHLKNGDRVSGKFIATKLRFETAFGVLEIPSSDLVRLSSVSVPLGEPSLVKTPVGIRPGMTHHRLRDIGVGPTIKIDSPDPFRRPR